MGTYETLKKAYIKSTGKDEPEVYAVLSFGALSGSIGAASVYRALRYPLSFILVAPPLPALPGPHVTVLAE